MNILITGSNGFIGKHLCNELKEYTLLTPRSYELNLLCKDDVDLFFIKNKINYIVHLAAIGVRITTEKGEDIALKNLKMFNNLMTHANSKCPMLLIGSGAEYDKQRSLIKVKESEWLNSKPVDSYGIGKHKISEIIYTRDYIYNLRVFGVYGMYEHPSRLPAYLIKCCINNTNIYLNKNSLFDFVYIKDLCKIIKIFIDKNIKEKFVNVCPDISISIKEFAEKTINFFPKFTGKIFFRSNDIGNEYTGSNSLLKNIIPNLKFLSYEEGISDYISDIFKYKLSND